MENHTMKGKICLVTGATAGIGEATALLLAKLGATVVGVGRNPAKIENSIRMIKEKLGNPDVAFLKADLSSQKDIRELAQQVKDQYSQLDVLVNNAGATFAERQQSIDGIEMTFALNHLGYFLLTNLMLDLLEKSAPARIINVSSSLHKMGKLDFTDIPFDNGYTRSKAYQRTKLANIAFTYELARRLSSQSVTVNVMNPGLVATNVGNAVGGFTAMIKGIVDKIGGITPEEGARTIIYLASSPEVSGVSGRYFVKEKSIPSSKISYDLEFCRRLWELSEELTTSLS
jgi:retinol dehydrogenase-12